MKHLNLLITLILLGISFLAGGFFFSNYAGSFQESNAIFPQNPTVDSRKINQVYNFLEQEYYDPEVFNNREVINEGAVSGLVDSLDDPYTVYYDEQEFQRLQTDLEGEFEGIGAQIGIRNRQVTIVTPLEGTPAKAAGLNPGDKILAINEVTTQGMNVDEAVNLIRGEKGSQVNLIVEKAESGEIEEISITRDVIDIPNVRSETRDGVGIVSWSQFQTDTVAEITEKLVEFRQKGIDKVVLDIRYNSGGFLQSSVDLVDLFVPSGKVVVIEKGREVTQKEYKTKTKGLFEDIKLVVLMNGGSASAAEITAGALRDIKGVKLIGETTFGKGVVQRLHEFSDGSAIKYTIAEWLTPNGDAINELGIAPDIELAFEVNEEDEDKDNQLDRAIQELLSE